MFEKTLVCLPLITYPELLSSHLMYTAYGRVMLFICSSSLCLFVAVFSPFTLSFLIRQYSYIPNCYLLFIYFCLFFLFVCFLIPPLLPSFKQIFFSILFNFLFLDYLLVVCLGVVFCILKQACSYLNQFNFYN